MLDTVNLSVEERLEHFNFEIIFSKMLWSCLAGLRKASEIGPLLIQEFFSSIIRQSQNKMAQSEIAPTENDCAKVLVCSGRQLTRHASQPFLMRKIPLLVLQCTDSRTSFNLTKDTDVV